MFIRTLKQKRGEKIYRHVQIVESFRDPAKGNAPRTRILANLGTVGFPRFCGHTEKQGDNTLGGVSWRKDEGNTRRNSRLKQFAW